MCTVERRLRGVGGEQARGPPPRKAGTGLCPEGVGGLGPTTRSSPVTLQGSLGAVKGRRRLWRGVGAALINKNIGIAFCGTLTGMLKIKYIIMSISLQLIFET